MGSVSPPRVKVRPIFHWSKRGNLSSLMYSAGCAFRGGIGPLAVVWGMRAKSKRKNTKYKQTITNECFIWDWTGRRYAEQAAFYYKFLKRAKYWGHARVENPVMCGAECAFGVQEKWTGINHRNWAFLFYVLRRLYKRQTKLLYCLIRRQILRWCASRERCQWANLPPTGWSW